MEKRCNENKSPDNQQLKTESTAVNSPEMADPVEIKPEIKVEPDEVDSIEYEVPLDRVFEPFTVKVEKVEPNDDEDKEDEAWEIIDLTNDPDSIATNRNSLIGMKPVDNEQPCSSQMVKHPNGRGEATKSRDGSSMDGTKVPKVVKSNGKSTKANKKTDNKRSFSLTRKKQHKCTICGYVTTFSQNLKRHMMKHTNERPFPCKSCAKRFTRKDHLQSHMEVHVKENSVNCSRCWEIFSTIEEKLDHESMCKRRRYECFLCQAYSTLNITNLKIHMRIHNGERPFKCAKCSMDFLCKSHLNRHIKTHSRPSKPRCAVCAWNFINESEKNAHEVNCKQRRYECYLCQNYMTSKRDHLQIHMRTRHIGERPFKCNSCGKCYAAKSSLKFHIKRSHKE